MDGWIKDRDGGRKAVMNQEQKNIMGRRNERMERKEKRKKRIDVRKERRKKRICE